MKNLSIIYYKKLISAFLFPLLYGQEPFLNIRPYVPPSFEQYPVSNCLDHHFPSTNQEDNVFLRFDGVEFTDDLVYPECLTGSSCYDGHAGIDYFMPLNTPILHQLTVMFYGLLFLRLQILVLVVLLLMEIKVRSYLHTGMITLQFICI